MENFPNSKRNLIREYLTYCRVEKGLAANSIESYENDLDRLRNWSDKTGFDLLTLGRRDLREWLIDGQHEQGRPNPFGLPSNLGSMGMPGARAADLANCGTV